MQRSDQQKYQELLDAIVTAKQEAYLILLNAFEEGIKEGIENHPYEQAKGFIFKALWQHLESLPLDQYQLSYQQFKEAIPLQAIVTQFLTAKSHKQDISENKKEMLYEAARFFYDLQNAYLLLKQQTQFFTANQVYNEALNIQRECNELTKRLKQCQASLTEYSTDQQGLLTYIDFYAGVASLADTLRLGKMPVDILLHADHRVVPAFACLKSLALKIRQGKVTAGLTLYEAEIGLPREKEYRHELRAFADRCIQVLGTLGVMIERLSQRYDRFKSELMQYEVRLQQLHNKEANLNAILALAQRMQAQPISREIVTLCHKQSSYPKVLMDGMALLSHKNNWHVTAEKLGLLLEDCFGNISSHANSFFEDFINITLRGMQKDKLCLDYEYKELRGFAPTLVIWQQCMQAIKAQANLIKRQTTDKQCCFFSLFSPKYEPLFKRDYLDLRIQEDIHQETAAMIDEMAAYEEAEIASSSRP